MPQATYWYGKGRLKNIDWVNDTIKLMLTTSGFTPNQDTDEYISDVTSEVSGTGYPAGGFILTNKIKTYDGATNTVKYDADDIEVSNANFTARWGVIYKDTGNQATSPVIAYIDFGGDIVAADVPFLVRWNADGILAETLAAPV